MVIVTDLVRHEEGEGIAYLLHPWTLTTWRMSLRDRRRPADNKVIEEGYLKSTSDSSLLWPENRSGTIFKIEKIVAQIRARVQWSYLYSKDYPRSTVAAVLAELTGKSLEEVLADLDELRRTTEPLPRPRVAKREQLMIALPNTDGNPVQGEINMAKTKGKKTEAVPRGGSRIVALSANTDIKDFKEGSHAHAVIKTLGTLKEASVVEITEYAVKHNLLGKSKMAPKQAISWIVGQLLNKRKLKNAGTTESVAASTEEKKA